MPSASPAPSPPPRVICPDSDRRCPGAVAVLAVILMTGAGFATPVAPIKAPGGTLRSNPTPRSRP